MLAIRPDERERLRFNVHHNTKTPGRENVHQRGLMTVHGKGLATGTQPTRTKSLQNLAGPATDKKPAAATEKKPTIHLNVNGKPRPLGDKTPMPNRLHPIYPVHSTPGVDDEKLAKLVLDTQTQLKPITGGTPASAPRPSSARTHLRAPRTSGGGNGARLASPIEAPAFPALNLPSHTQLQFQTPATNGRPWDVSPLAPSPLLNSLPLAPDVEEDDYDEIEYMPPKVDVDGWTPPEAWGVMPDYGEVGRMMRERAQGWAVDDDVDWEDMDTQFEGVEMPVVELPELDSALDDPFASALSTSTRPARAAVATTSRATTRRPLGIKGSTSAAGRVPGANTGGAAATRTATRPARIGVAGTASATTARTTGAVRTTATTMMRTRTAVRSPDVARTTPATASRPVAAGASARLARPAAAGTSARPGAATTSRAAPARPPTAAGASARAAATTKPKPVVPPASRPTAPSTTRAPAFSTAAGARAGASTATTRTTTGTRTTSTRTTSTRTASSNSAPAPRPTATRARAAPTPAPAPVPPSALDLGLDLDLGAELGAEEEFLFDV